MSAFHPFLPLAHASVFDAEMRSLGVWVDRATDGACEAARHDLRVDQKAPEDPSRMYGQEF